jgi:hypothetical protein
MRPVYFKRHLSGWQAVEWLNNKSGCFCLHKLGCQEMVGFVICTIGPFEETLGGTSCLILFC